MEENTTNEEKNVRGGIGSKGNPVEIKRAITEATKDLRRADNDVEKITRDKEELLRDLAELRVHESEKVPSVIKKTIEKSIRAVQRKLKEVNDTLPDVSLSDDQKKIHKIITDWKESKKILGNARRALARGEHKLATEPTNRRAMGDVNRAEATIYDTDQKINKLVQEAMLVEANNIKDPTADETISIHTEAEHNITQEQKNVGVVAQEDTSPSSPRAPEPIVSFAQQENEGILYSHEQALADQKKWEQKHKSSIEKIITSALEEITHSDISQKTETEQEENIIQTPETIIIKETTEAPMVELPTSEPHLLLDDGDDTPQENTTPEKSEEHIVPVSIEESPQEATSAVPKVTEQQNTSPSPIPSEQLPPYVEKILNDHLDKLFGNKGFLGFGTTKGRDSRHWKDSAYGFSTKTIEEIRHPHTTSEPTPKELWGVANEQERTKMHEYILQATNQTGIPPNPEEKVIDYIKRVLKITAHNNGQQQTS